ncbi:MAG: hypothetical protein LBL13_03065 [Bacteroidales bacterium]|jgi:ERCC4-type nuclease|nr:hypothetical protein [Bacteroidales bacterium]
MEIVPFTIIIDTREKLPYTFADIRTERKKAFVLTSVSTLPTGDYSIAGYENRICVERKSLEDLYHTLISGRDRFADELLRMQEFDRSIVMIEAGWQQIANPELHDPTWHYSAHPNSVIGTIISFAGKYPKTYWKAAGSRSAAQKETFKYLLSYYNHHITPHDNSETQRPLDGG